MSTISLRQQLTYASLLFVLLPRWQLRVGFFVTLFYGGYLRRYVIMLACAQPWLTAVLLLTDGNY